MAELLLKVGIDPRDRYADGDVIAAFNSRRIKQVHAEHVCDFRAEGFNSYGLRIAGSLSEFHQLKTFEFKFERVSTTEIKRTKISDGSFDIIGPTPNANGEAMDVEQYIQNRRKHESHRIYGVDGSEYWFGGTYNPSAPKLNLVWQEIETRTPLLESNHRKWPVGNQEFKSFLPLSVTDFTDDYTNFLMSELSANSEGQFIKKRMCFVNWRAINSIPSITKNKIDDPAESVDIRDLETFVTENLIQVKGLNANARGV